MNNKIEIEPDLSFQTQVVKFLCLSGLSVGVGFGFYHLLWGNPYVSLTLLPVILLQAYVFYSLKVNGYQLHHAYVVAIVQTMGTVVFIRFVGLPATYWIFASAVANYFIVTARPALAINLLAIAGASLLIFDENLFVVRLASSFLLMNLFLYFFSRQLDVKTAQVNELLFRDPLTRVGNRLAMDEALQIAHHSFERYGNVVSLLMLDLDFFKKVNDRYGHTEGDKLLLELATLIRKRLRASDRLFRFGGEEFVILAENTDLESASQLADGVRELVGSRDFARVGSITISIGVAQLQQGESIDGWIKRADDALYQAKSLGRNTICVKD